MGITIFASGRIDRIEDIERLIEDVKAIADESKWAHRILDDDFDMQPNAVLSGQDRMAALPRSKGLWD